MPVTTEPNPPQTVLAFDFGLRRIGVAIGQTVTGSATSLKTLEVSTAATLRSEVGELIRDWHPDSLLVGMPRQANGDSAITADVRRFAKILGQSGLPVHFVDETLSSVEASARLKSARQLGRRQRIQKHDIDAESARIIAERWLEEN